MTALAELALAGIANAALRHRDDGARVTGRALPKESN